MTGAQLFSRMLDEPRAWGEFLLTHWPTSPSGSLLRRWYWGSRLGTGASSDFARGVVFDLPQRISVGRRCAFSEDTAVLASESAGIFIGDNVIVGPGTLMRGANHRFDRLDIPIRDQGHQCRSWEYRGRAYSIVVEDNVWLGARVVLLSGAWIGAGSIIGAGRVIKERIPANSVAGQHGIYPRRSGEAQARAAAVTHGS